MFPKDVTFDTVQANTKENSTLGRSFAFDYTTGQFQFVDGALCEQGEVENIKQWIELMLRTTPGKYKIYDGTQFGVHTDTLINNRTLPDGFVWSELKREITAAVQLCPVIDTVDNFVMSRDGRMLIVSFTVRLKSGEQTEVNIDVGTG